MSSLSESFAGRTEFFLVGRGEGGGLLTVFPVSILGELAG